MTARSSDELDGAARELFAQNVRLAYWWAVRFARKWPDADLDDLRQVCLLSLAESARKFNPREYDCKFSHYASKYIRFAAWARIKSLPGHGKNPPEDSMEEPRGRSEGDEITLGDALDLERGRDEATAGPGRDREQARLFELRELIETLPTLTDGERKVLRARFVHGLTDEQITERHGVSSVRVISSLGIRKLRSHFRRLGFRVARGKIRMPIEGWSKPKVRNGRR
jgi:RNA polymerase sigma factor (sigma-70 family)